MTKLLLLLIVLLVGCNTQEPQTCQYTHLDRDDLTCLSIPAAKWNWKPEKGLAPDGIWIRDICRSKYDGEWVYGNTDTELIKHTMKNGSFLDNDIQFVTSYGEVSQWTCYYYNVE